MPDPSQGVAEARVKLEEIDWYRLKAAHGDMFHQQAIGRQRMRELQQDIAREVQAKTHAFDALMKTLGERYHFDASRVSRWDEETQEVILD